MGQLSTKEKSWEIKIGVRKYVGITYIYILELLSKISSIKVFCSIIIIFFLLTYIIKLKFLSYILIIDYLIIFLLSFSLENYGIDSVRLAIMKSRLSPVAYMSYKQDLEIMKNLRAKRRFSFYIYENIERINKEFEYILDYLEKSKANSPKILKNKKEYIEMI